MKRHNQRKKRGTDSMRRRGKGRVRMRGLAYDTKGITIDDQNKKNRNCPDITPPGRKRKHNSPSTSVSEMKKQLRKQIGSSLRSLQQACGALEPLPGSRTLNMQVGTVKIVSGIKERKKDR